MKKRLIQHSISGVFVFLLLGVFAVSGTVMVVLGAKAYRGITERGEAHLSHRIAPAYLRSMLRGSDAVDAIRLETVEGIDTISLVETYDGEEYATRLYVYDGHLYEWFSEAAAPFEPTAGDVVTEAESMSAGVDGGLMTVNLTAGGENYEIQCALYAARP
ncbi:MAG: DUF4860 domain-containing protein [Clostridia bacterium]|nr:DUF4860 domain-containing protein [Clostridia bacterium]